MRRNAKWSYSEPVVIDHDGLFKTLLLTFFAEFVQAFLPDVAAQIDLDSIAFQPQELLPDLVEGKKHLVDLLVKVKRRGEEVFLLIHIENQSRVEPDFAFRMFRYAALLHIKYRLPVYSIVIFSHDAPTRPEPHGYKMLALGKTGLQSDYTVIQLNRLSWRKFIQKPNPVAAALMTKMNIAPKDRLKVTREIVRIIATLQLDPARTHLIANFMDAYLKLNAEEIKQYERKYSAETTETERTTMEFLPYTFNLGKQEGWQTGLKRGKEELVVRLINRRFGSTPPQIANRLDGLSAEDLDELGLALMDFTSPADLETWLARQNR